MTKPRKSYTDWIAYSISGRKEYFKITAEYYPDRYSEKWLFSLNGIGVREEIKAIDLGELHQRAVNNVFVKEGRRTQEEISTGKYCTQRHFKILEDKIKSYIEEYGEDTIAREWYKGEKDMFLR